MSNDEILRRLQVLEDREAIKQTWTDCMYRIDNGEWALLEDVFTQDVVLRCVGWDKVFPGADRVREGRDAVINEHFVATAPRDLTSDEPMAAWRTAHVTTNLDIDLQGDAAAGRSLLWEVVANDIAVAATYQLQFRREAERWRIAEFTTCAIWFARLESAVTGGNENWWP